MQTRFWIYVRGKETPKQFLQQLLEDLSKSKAAQRVTADELVKRLSRFCILAGLYRVSQADDLRVALLTEPKDHWESYQVGYCCAVKPTTEELALREFEKHIKQYAAAMRGLKVVNG